MKKIKIGIIGFGTIGSGVHHLINKNGCLIKDRTGIDLEIKSICDLNTDQIKNKITGIEITDNWKDIVNDDEIDIVVELIGGIEPANSIVLDSFKKGKGVVTANKKLLAENGMDIFKEISKNGSRLGFEAAIGGGIPCILALQTGLVGNNIRSIMGILNGTTNYILTQMEEKGDSFEKILKNAQDLGFAEADPTFDIEGYDAGHKIALLAMMAYNRNVDFNRIPIEGITRISDIDISFAKDMGYAIKLLGIARLIDGKLDISVHPTMIPEKHPLSSVRDEFNAVMFDGDMTDPIILHGKGAGSNPTASAVVSDIVRIAETAKLEKAEIQISGDAEYITPDKRFSKYYLRIHTKDKPGILSKISGVLGNNNISIASVIQKETNTEYVSLIILTHEVDEAAIAKAADEIGNFDFTENEVMIIRVEDH